MKKALFGFILIILMSAAVVGVYELKIISDEKLAEIENGNETEKAENVYDETSFCSQIPLIVIDTDEQTILKEDKIWAEASIINGEDQLNHLDDTAEYTGAITIKYRGSSSYLVFNKKSYRIEFFEEEDSDKEKDYDLLGMGASSEWVLYGPYLDRSLVRNKLMYDLSAEMLPWSPECKYIELFIDGEYQGIYLAVEAITNEANRMNLTQFGLLSGQTSYIIHREKSGIEPDPLETYGNTMGYTQHEVSVLYPGSTKITDEQREWITKDLEEFEKVLYSDYFDDPTIGYAAYIDVDSFVDYYILNEFAQISDAGYISTYTYKNLGGKLTMTVWDFNNGFNNYQWINFSPDEFCVAENNWFKRLLQDRAFTEAVVERYHELRQGIMSDASLEQMIDEDIAYLGDAVDRNFTLWGYTFHQGMLCDDEEGNERDPKSFEEAVTMLKETIFARGAFLDNHIEDLYDYCNN